MPAEPHTHCRPESSRWPIESQRPPRSIRILVDARRADFRLWRVDSQYLSAGNFTNNTQRGRRRGHYLIVMSSKRIGAMGVSVRDVGMKGAEGADVAAPFGPISVTVAL